MFGIIRGVFFIWIQGVVTSSSDVVKLTLNPCHRGCTVIAGSVFNITCQRSDSAVAWFTWYLESGQSGDRSNALTQTQASAKKGVNSTLSFVPERKYHGWKLYCMANVIEDTSYLVSDRTILYVLYGPDKPLFKVGGQYINSTVSILVGSNLSVECSGNSNPSATVTWHHGHSQQNGAFLNLTNIDPNGAGILQCALENQMKSSDNNERYGKNDRFLNLEILTPPTTPIISDRGFHILKNINLIEGRDYGFYCSSSGKPSPQIHWKLMNSTIEQDVLQIRNVSALYSTTITCCAKNHMIPTFGVPEHGLECTHLNVNVLHKPMFAFNAKYDVKENDSFSISCTQQNINTVVTWVKQGDDNWSEAHNTIHWTNVRRRTLAIIPADYDPASVTTFEAFGHSDYITVNENDSVTFRCNATGNPSPNIRIKSINGILKKKNGFYLRYTENMTCAQTGRYSCYVKNIINKVEAKSKDIDVVVKCSPRPATNMSSDFNTTTALHSTVILNFTVMAYPVPQPSDYVWKKCDDDDSNGTLECCPLVDGGQYNIAIVDLTSHLTISDFTQHDIGRYMLSVGNGIGDAWNQTFVVVIKDKPEAPKLFYESTSPHSAILTTIAGYDGGVSQAIVLLYKNIQSTEWVMADAISDVPTNRTVLCTLTGLDSNINYNAMAFASNEFGNSTVVSIDFTTAVHETPILTFSIAGCGSGLLVCIVVAIVVYKLQCRNRGKIFKIEADRGCCGRNALTYDEVVENPMYIPAGESFVYQVSRIIPELPHTSADDATIYSSPYSYTKKDAPFNAEKNVSKSTYHNVYDEVQCWEEEEDEFWPDFSDED